MRVFLATGEASGDMLAAALATAMRELEPGVRFVGIGNERMSAAGIGLTSRTTGWASMGPAAAIRRIPPLFVNMWRHALWLRSSPWDLVVLVDFGASNLRFAKTLRLLGYPGPILYFFPPGAWLDRASQARAVARYTVPLTPFEHQRAFYASLGLEAAYFGHPLRSLIEPRAPRPPAAADCGIVALLPGSRRAEIGRHLGRLLKACRLVRARRPNAQFLVSAADADMERLIAAELKRTFFDGVRIVRGAAAALDGADAAWIASGTAVLEAALREVPAVALYVIEAAQVALAKRILRHPYITLPNILLGREVVPERLQEDATPQRLADAMEDVLRDPAPQLAGLRDLRAALGPPDALRRCAAFAVALARGGSNAPQP
jgi:lipid-A-disaccharide synthase